MDYSQFSGYKREKGEVKISSVARAGGQPFRGVSCCAGKGGTLVERVAKVMKSSSWEEWSALQRQNAENSKKIFPEKELRSLSPISKFMFL
jgi:hypothetical protein